MAPVIDDPLKPLSEIYKPDERQANLLDSLEVVHAGLSVLVLHENVPLDVRQLFETAKNVRLYAYFVYRFHQVAELLAYQVLERALKTRWNSEISHRPSVDDADYNWPGLAKLLKHARESDWIRNEGFSSLKYRARISLEQEQVLTAIKEMIASGNTENPQLIPLGPTLTEVEERATQIDVVLTQETVLPSLRNQLAHGSTRLSPTSDFVLRDVCDAINMIFDGKLGTVKN